MEPENIADTEAKVEDFLAGLLAQYKAHNRDGTGTWIFGDEVGPTVLDGNAAPLLARLLDREERAGMVPEELKGYMKKITALPEWETILQGHSTMYTSSIGDVAAVPLK